MKPTELLDAASDLIEQPRALTGSLWARAATFLARQALEQRMADILAVQAPGSEDAPFRAKLLVLGEVLGNSEVAARASYTWAALSGASHHHGYELPPTIEELRDWLEAVERFLEESSAPRTAT
jgi:hypothetical protein